MYKAQIFHAALVKSGLQNHVYHCNILLQAYIKSQALFDAHKLLYLMPHPTVVSYNTILSGYFKSHLVSEALELFKAAPKTDCQSWNIVISGCSQNQRLEEALTHFVKMRHGSIRPDNFTYAIVIPYCDFDFGQQLHAEIIKVCPSSDAFLGTNLLRMYAGGGAIEGARKVFDGMPHRDLVTWNALISCYSQYGMGDRTIELFRQLGREGIVADEYTYAIVLNEFASCLLVFEAMQIHSLIIQRGFCSDRFTSNALLNLYSKCGFVSSASRLFEEMPEQDVVSWTAIISGFLQSGCIEDVMQLFHKMQLAAVKPNSFTFGGLLSACANAGVLRKGKQFHGLVLKFGLGTNAVVGSAIVDMYSKCAEMDDALRVFQSMPERDIVSWNVIICGFAQNGKAMNALKLYNEMVQLGPSTIAPNDVTFVGVLSACSHCGLLKEGFSYFNDMMHKHLIKPKLEHYTCMVDLLGRAGLLHEAEALILGLPFKPDSITWGALLGACKLHGNLQMAKRITEHLYVDEPLNSSNYVLLANSYADDCGWGEAIQARELMDVKGVQKIVGCSWVEIGSCVHPFIASDKLHPQIGVVFEVLQRICLQTEESYYNESTLSLN